LAHGNWRVSEGGEGADAWYVFEPIDPQPASAPLAVVMHGYYEYAGYESLHELIRHTVRTGRVVIYPRWQTDVATPCPGPIDIEPCIASAVQGIEGALAFLQADPSRVQPELERTSYFGFSFGGILTANLANRWQSLGVPRPRAIFLDEPHDGGLTGTDEPALDDTMTGIPASTLVECHVGAQGTVSEEGMADASCNALWPLLEHLPEENRALVLTRPDAHGQPALRSDHGVCTSRPGEADAYDWNFCWKVWDALQAMVNAGSPSPYALSDTPEHRSMGSWSDGVAVTPLEISDGAPIPP
jgi:acetyl esterase/lipase